MNVILLGPPGAGKGTQAKFLIRERSMVQLSTGDMLREARRSGTEVGDRVARIMDAGELVTDEIVIELIGERIKGERSAGFIFDGFPGRSRRRMPWRNCCKKTASNSTP